MFDLMEYPYEIAGSAKRHIPALEMIENIS